MPKAKGKSQQQRTNPPAEPKASRPYMPGYGLPTSKKGLLSWSHVTERMASARHYWVCTVSPDSHPHATPVDGLWLDDRLYFGGNPTTRRNRNLAENPEVCIHLGDAIDVVILHGEANVLLKPDRSLAIRLAEASKAKYGYAPNPEEMGAGGVYVFRPRWALAWKQFLKDATRWQID